MNEKISTTHKPIKMGKKFFLLYSGAFLICAALCYFWFIINKKTLIINSDGWRQHFAAFVYFGKYGREVLHTLLSTHKLVLPQWDFSIGLGSDILTTLHFYAIGDPLDLLSIACPAKYASYLYSILSLFRLYLSGLCFGAFCFVKKQNHITSVTVGSLVYVFTLFGMFIVSHHPFFAIPMIYLPLLLLGAEQIMAGKRPYLFIATVFLAAISNFYFFYMLALFTAIYTLFVLICRYRHHAKEAFAAFFKIAGSAILGVILSAVILLPVILAFVGDGRSSESYVHTWIYNMDYYRNFLASMFNSQTKPGYLTYLGYNAVALPAVCVLFFTKNKSWRPLRLVFLGTTAMLLIPAFGWAFNGFSYMANRWVWAYGMVIAYIVTVTWQELCKIDIRKGFGTIGAIAVYFAVAVSLMKTVNHNIIFSAVIALLTVIACMVGTKSAKKFVAPVFAIILVFASFSGNAAYFYTGHGENHLARYISYGQVNKKIKRSAASKVKKAAKGDDTFYRYSGGKVNYNEGAYVGMNGTSFYWSMENKNLAEFVNETEQPVNAAYMFKGFNDSVAMNAVTNVKYYVKNKKVALPYGFEKLKGKVYQNKNALPLGYATDNVIKKSEYDKFSSLEKQQALLQGVVLDNVPDNMNTVSPNFTYKSVPYTVISGENVSVDGEKIHVYNNKSKIKIQFSGSENQETYLRFTLKDYTDYPAYTYYQTQKNDSLNRYSKDEWDKMSKKEQNKVKKDAKSFALPSQLKLRFSTKTESGKKYKTDVLTCYSSSYVRYTGAKTYLVGIGYTDEAKKSITITFDKPGIYDLTDIEVFEQPVDKETEQIAEFKADIMQNIKLSDNKIAGTINLQKAKILFLSIPYSQGWSATVDGKKAELLQADTAFSALSLSKGQHKITLEYHTPYLKAGAYVSTVGVLAFAAVIITTEKRRKRIK